MRSKNILSDFKKSILLFCLCLCCGVTIFAASYSAHADNPPEKITTEVVKHETSITYRYFDYPTAVFADGECFYVADGSTAYSFDENGKELNQTLEIPASTQKLTAYGNSIIALAGGVLYIDDTDCGTFTDFAKSGSKIYAVNGDDNGSIYALDLSDESEDKSPRLVAEYSVPLEKIAADRSGVYVSVPNEYNPYYSDIVRYNVENDGALSSPAVYIYDALKILQMEGLTEGVACRTSLGIYYYKSAESSAQIFSCYDAATIAASGNTIYGIGNLKSVFRIDSNMERTELLASAHTGKDFFHANAGFATRKQKIAVADELNNRIRIITESESTAINGVIRPKAVVIDYVGNIYAAHDSNKISVFDSDNKQIRQFSLGFGNTVIADLEIDSDNNLYVLAKSGQIYKVAAGKETFDATDLPNNAAAMTMARNSDELFYADTESNIARVSDGKKFACKSQIKDFCTDHDGSFYVLTALGGILKYGADGIDNERGTLLKEASADFVNATAIEMNTVVSEGAVTLSYGDLLVSDTGAHALKKIDRELLEVNKDFEITSDDKITSDPDLYMGSDESIIFTVTDCDIYAQQAEINPVTSLKNGVRVIIPDYDENAKFNFIITDNISGGENAAPIAGYVYTSLISERIAYKASPSPTCFTYVPNVTVYKYPSFNAPKFPQSLDKNTFLTLPSFVYSETNGKTAFGYVDNFAHKNRWYRIAYRSGGELYEGYVISDSISMRGETPDDRNVYPRYNAVIISKEKGKDIPATLYEKDADGNILPVSDGNFLPLAVGTKVEVVGAFDSSEKYTLIKYYLEGVGTVRFYVETANIKYHGVNKVVVIAIVIIVLTVILGIILVARYLYVKRNKKMDATKL